MTEFALPPIPPDFTLMHRAALEDYAAEVDHILRAKSARLDNDVAALTVFLMAVGRAACYPDPIPKVKRPSRKASQVICALRVTVRSRSEIYAEVYSEKSEADQPLEKTIDVWLSRARWILALIDCPIQNVWGQGYALPNRAQLQQLVAEYQATGTLPELGFET